MSGAAVVDSKGTPIVVGSKGRIKRGACGEGAGFYVTAVYPADGVKVLRPIVAVRWSLGGEGSQWADDLVILSARDRSEVNP